MSKSVNAVKSQATPAALFAKHADTLVLLATSVHGMQTAKSIIESATESKAKCMEAIKLCVKALRADKVTIGALSRKDKVTGEIKTIGCQFADAIATTLSKLGVQDRTITNYVSEVRKAVNTGSAFTLNSAREAAKAREAEAKKREAIEAAKTGPATLVPPAAESKAGDNVTVHTHDTIAEVQERDTSNGAPVQVQPNATKHERAKALCVAIKPMLGDLFLLAGAMNMKGNQAALTAIAEELSRIESEIVDAMKR